MAARTIVKIQTIAERFMPVQATEGAAGYDVFSSSHHIIPPGDTEKVPLGFSLEMPKGMYATIEGRSGLVLTYRVRCHRGIIDNDYRGEVCAIIHNDGDESFKISQGARIAQLTFHRSMPITLSRTRSLSATERGVGGFGSTGISDLVGRDPQVRITDTLDPPTSVEKVSRDMDEVEEEKEKQTASWKTPKKMAKKKQPQSVATTNRFDVLSEENVGKRKRKASKSSPNVKKSR